MLLLFGAVIADRRDPYIFHRFGIPLVVNHRLQQQTALGIHLQVLEGSDGRMPLHIGLPHQDEYLKRLGCGRRCANSEGERNDATNQNKILTHVFHFSMESLSADWLCRRIGPLGKEPLNSLELCFERLDFTERTRPSKTNLIPKDDGLFP